MVDGEREVLIERETDADNTSARISGFTVADEIMRDYFIMAIPFAIIYSAYEVTFGYLSSIFSVSVASYASGASYLTYSLTALLVAAYIVNTYGPRPSLLFASCLYILFFVCVITAGYIDSYNARFVLIVTGSVFKGFASPIGWVSQGVFFASYAERYAVVTKIEVTEANSIFAGYFASIYVGGFGLFFLFSSVLLQFTAITGIELFITFGACTMASSVFMFVFLKPITAVSNNLVSGASAEQTQESALDRAKAVLVMATTDVSSMCLTPLTITFGFVRIFMFVVVDERVAANNFPTYVIGYLNVLYAATTTLVAIPVAKYLSKSVAVGLGSISYLLLALAFVCFSYSQLGVSQYIWILFVLYGLGTLSFESTTKAIYADLYPEKKAVAFAHLTFFSGMASTVFSFVEAANITGETLGICILFPAACMVPGYLLALKLRGKV